MIDYGLDLSAVDHGRALPDLVAEGDSLDALVSAQADWSVATPAAGWTIAHQIAHLAAADANVLIAIRAPEAFDSVAADADLEAAAGAAQPRSELLERWRAGRRAVEAALRDMPLDRAFPWFGSDLTPALMVPLRLLETWAHGQDVFDAVGVARSPTARLHHVACLGVVGRALSFYAAQLTLPVSPFCVSLTAPDGSAWTWGPSDAAQRVQGSALDFCLLVTRRRALGSTDLTSVGVDAATWLGIARVVL